MKMSRSTVIAATTHPSTFPGSMRNSAPHASDRSEMNTVDLLNSALNAVHVTRSFDEGGSIIPTPIDEISLLFKYQHELLQFRDEAIALGAFHFNSVVRDRMDREDVAHSNFDVRFEFLRIEDDWRIEAMCPMWGTYPLHAAELRKNGSGCVMHASYKLPTEEDYFVHIGGLDSTLSFGASYRNSYGRFSYWSDPVSKFPWFKPRVNLRDK
jgi:hypothetical protein